jgi:hypothetical protein
MSQLLAEILCLHNWTLHRIEIPQIAAFVNGVTFAYLLPQRSAISFDAVDFVQVIFFQAKFTTRYSFDMNSDNWQYRRVKMQEK